MTKLIGLRKAKGSDESADLRTRETEGEIVPLGWHDAVERLLLMGDVRLLCLVGEAAVGKTRFARYLCRKLLGKEPVIVNGNPECDLSSLWGRWTLKGSDTVYVPAGLTIGLKENRPVIIEDFSLVPIETRATCMGLDQREIEQPFTHEMLAIPEDFLLVCTSNDETLSCRRNSGIAAVLWDRFTIVPIPEPNRTEIQKMLQANVPQATVGEREMAIELYLQWREFSGISNPNKRYLTFRSLVRLTRMLHAGLEQSEAVELALINALMPLDKEVADAARLKLDMSRPAANAS